MGDGTFRGPKARKNKTCSVARTSLRLEHGWRRVTEEQ